MQRQHVQKACLHFCPSRLMRNGSGGVRREAEWRFPHQRCPQPQIGAVRRRHRGHQRQPWSARLTKTSRQWAHVYRQPPGRQIEESLIRHQPGVHKGPQRHHVARQWGLAGRPLLHLWSWLCRGPVMHCAHLPVANVRRVCHHVWRERPQEPMCWKICS